MGCKKAAFDTDKSDHRKDLFQPRMQAFSLPFYPPGGHKELEPLPQGAKG